MSYRSRTYSGDPYWLTARFASPCSQKGCTHQIQKGELAFYYPNGKKILCQGDDCGGQAARDFEAAKADESFYGGGSY